MKERSRGHRWEYTGAFGRTPPAPHGVTEGWRCVRCDAVRVYGPEWTEKGRRVMRWRHTAADGDHVPGKGAGKCPGA